MKKDSFSYSLKNFFFYCSIILIGYFFYAYNGKFIIDDFSIVNSDKKLNLFEFYEIFEVSFGNRPLAIIYYFLISKLPSNYLLYFTISLSQHILCIFLIYKLFDFLFYSEEIKKIFFLLIIFPFFSFTTLYSPAMQSIGNYSLAIFLFALILLKKFIVEKKKYLYVFSILLIISAFLTYESFFPLIILFIFFPLIYKQNYKILFINLFFILIILLVVFIFQKYFAYKPQGEDLSRIRNLNIFSLISLCFVNLFLLINFFLENFYDAFLNIKSLLNKNLYFALTQIFFLNFIFIYFIFKLRRGLLNNVKPFKIFFIIIFIIFLTILMHSVADTGIELRDYNNRGMLAMSFVPSIFLLLLYNSTIKNSYIVFFKFLFIFFYCSIIINFFSFQQYEYDKLDKFKKIYLTVKEDNFINNKTFLFIKIEPQNYIENKYSYSPSNYFYNFQQEDIDYLEKIIVKNNLNYKKTNQVIEINDFTVVFNLRHVFCKYFLINDDDLKRHSNFITLNITEKTYMHLNLTELKQLLYSEKNTNCANEYEFLLKKLFNKNKVYLDEKNIPILIKNLYIYNLLKYIFI
jgi:hypothetical protein